MSFGNPAALWMVFVIILISLLGFWGWKIKQNMVELFKLDTERARKSQIKKYIIAGVLLMLLIVALALPRLPVFTPGGMDRIGEIALLVDVSKSMAAERDLGSPNRLERVKPILLEIVENFPEAEIGLYGLTRGVRSHVPFTKDQSYLRRSIERVLDINSVLGRGTNFGEAILGLTDKFSEDEKAKIIVLFSDGEPFGYQRGMSLDDEQLLEKAIRKAAQDGIIVITVGVGEKEGAKIPLYDEEGKFTGVYSEFRREIYITYLEEEILRKIASQTGGRYFLETDQKGIIDYIEKNLVSGSAQEGEEHQDIVFWFFLPIVALWIIFARYYLR